jgi:hypothetical protein
MIHVNGLRTANVFCIGFGLALDVVFHIMQVEQKMLVGAN